MSLSADVPPFVSRPVFHGNAPSQYHLPQGGGYIAANPQVASVPPPAPSANNQGGGYPHYMVNCYPYVAESVPQDGRQQSYPTQAGATPYTVPHASHPYQTPSPYDGYQQQQPQQQQPMYQPLPPEQQGITTYQDPYYPSAYYPQVPPQPSFQQPLPQGVQGPVQHPPAPGYAAVPPPSPYQVPYTTEPQGYHQHPPPQLPQVKHKNYSGNKHRSARYSNDHSNVGCEAVAAELEAVKKKKMVVYTDADCQTDFPEHIANKTLSERPIEELVPSVKAVTKSTGNQTGPDDGSGGNRSSSDSCEEEEEEEELKPQDSDSGYSAAGDVSGGKSYARVASQHYMPQQPYQQQWPLPPTMSSQGSGPVSTAPVSSWARIAAGGHPPALHHPPSSQHQYPPHQIQHQPSGHHPHHPHQQHHRQPMPQPQYQQQGQMVPHSQHQSHMASQGQQQGHMASQNHHQGHMVPQGQQQGHMTPQSQHQDHMAPHSQHQGPSVPHGQHQGPMVPHAPPAGVAPQQQFPGHYPPAMQAQPGVVRLPPQPGPKNHPRQRRKTSGPQWVPPPPPMINDASEYPDLPVAANRSMMGYGGNPTQPNYSNILQQKLKVNNEIDSDTSSEKDLPHSMLQSEELRGNKMFRKKIKKPSQDYLGMMVSPAPPQDTAKMTGKRSQRPMEIPLTGLLLNNPPQAPQQSFMPGGQMPFNAGPQQFMGPPPPMAYQQQPQLQQQSMGQIPVQWANNVPGTRGPTLRAHDRNEIGRKNISGNPLDSSGVTMKGKQRENPAKKKPSAMKKVIIAERQEKKRIRDMQEKKLSDNEDALSQSTVELESSCYDSSFGLSQDPPSDRNSLSFNTHSDYSPVSQQDQLSLSPLSPGMGASSQNGGICSSQTEVLAMKQIHSNKWREYCKQIVSKEIDASCTTLLQTLIRFQERQYNRDGPIKAKSKRRIVMGLREVSKHLEKGKITCIIISTNLEKIQSKGGIDDVLQKITIKAEDMGVPVVYALCRSALGRAVNKIVPVSVVGVFSYNGAEDVFKELTSLVETARKEYQELLLEQKHVIEMKNVRNMKKLGHRRNISNCSGISFSSVISNPISENDPEPEPEDELEELEGPTEATEVCEDAGSVNRESSTEKTNSEASACTVEERQRRALAQQDQPSDQPCDHIADEGAAAGVRDEEGDSEGDERNIGDEDHDDDEDEEDDSEKALAPEISVDERVNSWVAENQIQNISVEEKA